MCLKNHSSLWRQQQKVHCCSYTPSGILYKTDRNIRQSKYCQSHSLLHAQWKSSVSAHGWNKISWFRWRAEKETVGVPRDRSLYTQCFWRHDHKADLLPGYFQSTPSSTAASSKHAYLYLDGLSSVPGFTLRVMSPAALVFPLILPNTPVTGRETSFKRIIGLSPKVNAGLIWALFHTESGRKWS